MIKISFRKSLSLHSLSCFHFHSLGTILGHPREKFWTSTFHTVLYGAGTRSRDVVLYCNSVNFLRGLGLHQQGPWALEATSPPAQMHGVPGCPAAALHTPASCHTSPSCFCSLHPTAALHPPMYPSPHVCLPIAAPPTWGSWLTLRSLAASSHWLLGLQAPWHCTTLPTMAGAEAERRSWQRGA